MTNKPIRTFPVTLLTLPGVLLLLGSLVALYLQSSGALDSGNHTVSEMTLWIIGAGLLLVPAALISSLLAIFYAIRRSGNGLHRAVFVILNVLMLIVAFASLAGLLVTVMVLLANPG